MAQATGRRLPLARTISEVFAGATGNYVAFLSIVRIQVFFVVLGLALIVWSGYRAGIGDVPNMLRLGLPGEPGRYVLGMLISRMSSFEFYAGVALAFVSSAIVAIRLHRFILLADTKPPPLAAYRRYAWTLTKVALVYGLFGFFVYYVLTLLMLPAQVDYVMEHRGSLLVVWIFNLVFGLVRTVLASAVSMRLSLALPDAATEGRGRVISTFVASHGNTWRLVLCDLAVRCARLLLLWGLALGCGAVSGSFLEEFGKLEGATAFVVLLVLGAPLYFYLLMLEVGLLSVAYREIVGLPGSREGQPASEPAPEPAPAL
ncbi:MAG: hypothetical protein RH982_12665 [Parvibaculum sp.]